MRLNPAFGEGPTGSSLSVLSYYCSRHHIKWVFAALQSPTIIEIATGTLSAENGLQITHIGHIGKTPMSRILEIYSFEKRFGFGGRNCVGARSPRLSVQQQQRQEPNQLISLPTNSAVSIQPGGPKQHDEIRGVSGLSNRSANSTPSV